MIRSIKLNTDTLIQLMLGSAVIGIGMSYGDFLLFHLILMIVCLVLLFQIKNTNYKLLLNERVGHYDLMFLLMIGWYAFS